MATSAEGALLVRVTPAASTGAGLVLLDTASPVSLWDVPAPATPVQAQRRDLEIRDADAPGVLRATLGNISVLGTRLGTIASAPDGQPAQLAGILGGDFLQSYAVKIDGGTPSVAFSDELPVSTTFLSAHGYAVLRVPPLGGGQLDAESEADFLGQRAPYEFPATRLVLRACAAPTFVDPSSPPPLPASCCRGDEVSLATGVNLSLVLGTGYGPLVLSESAWQRLRAGSPGLPDASQSRPLSHPAFSSPEPARWGSIPRLALVDRETSANDDAGPCVELARSRRIEQVAVLQAAAQSAGGANTSAACVQPCDQDPRDLPKARDSAGYLELGGDIPVAVVSDSAPMLQSLRAEIRPEGPEIDGIAGAVVFALARLEIDYRPRPMRLVASCPTGVSPQSCRAIGRCPRLPKVGDTRLCFGLPPHGLPKTCNNLQSTCP